MDKQFLSYMRNDSCKKKMAEYNLKKKEQLNLSYIKND